MLTTDETAALRKNAIARRGAYECEEVGLADDVEALCDEYDKLRARVTALEQAIAKHRDEFPDEPMAGEHELWRTLEGT